MSTYKILVVEDEVLIAEHIKDYLISLGLNNVSMVHNKKHALEAIDHIRPDLVLLDIHLQDPLDGIELAKLIDEKKHIPYIFITANSDLFVVQKATLTKPAAYITKPIKKSDLFAAIQIALNTSRSQEDVKYLLVKDNGLTCRIPQNEILFIESSGNYINIITKAKKIIARHSLEWAEQELPDSHFLRVHRSFIVRLSAIQQVSTKSVFIDEIEIPISRAYASKVADYFGKKRKT